MEGEGRRDPFVVKLGGLGEEVSFPLGRIEREEYGGFRKRCYGPGIQPCCWKKMQANNLFANFVWLL